MRVPSGVDEAAVRRTLLNSFNIEVGAGLGPLAGKIWRVGLMGASSTHQTLLQFLAALEEALVLSGQRVPSGAGVAAASAAASWLAVRVAAASNACSRAPLGAGKNTILRGLQPPRRLRLP